MNASQQCEIIKLLEQLRGSKARVSFRSGNDIQPYIAVLATASGRQISSECRCVKVATSVRFYQYEMSRIVLNKIIEQAKNNK
jgi:hypothetical protein